MSNQPTFMDRLWDFFCSLKLAIGTLILLALTSIIGTVIEQGKTPEEISAKTGWSLDLLRFLDNYLNAFDMYHSWWFLALLGLFATNLICCSIKRFPFVWKTVRDKRLVGDDNVFRTLSNVEEAVVAKGNPAEVRERVAALFKGRFAEPVVTEQDGAIYLYAEKGAYSRFGVYVTHASILIIFAGAMIGNLWGYKAFVNIPEGGGVIDSVWVRGDREQLPLGFSVRCDDFEVEYYEGMMGRPKEYSSQLAVLENGREVLSKRIEVNDPLTYKGITFYQSSFGPAGDPTFRLRVRPRAGGTPHEFTARLGEHVTLPDGGTFAVTNYAENYDRFGAAIQAHLGSADGGHGEPFILLKNFPDFDAQRNDAQIFTLVDFEQRYYTGLQVAKDPGVWVVWLGCFLMVCGSCGAFFLSHRRLWAVIRPLDKGVGVKLGGSAHRNQPGFALYFDTLRKELKETLSGK